jgi:hypothetical protein
MPFPTPEVRLADAEEQLGRRLPDELRRRLIRDNGGEIEADDDVWQLFSVWDPTNRRTTGRTTNHIVRETELVRRELPGYFPDDAIAIAADGGGNYLILRIGSSQFELWDHETAESSPVEILWD